MDKRDMGMLMAVVLTGCSHALPGAVRATAGVNVLAASDAVPGEVIVKYRANRAPPGSRVLREVPGVGAQVLPMAVGATNDQDYLPNFENTGKYISVVAPGVEILSTMPKGGYDSFDGTSASVPFVSGIAALLKSQHPTWTAKQLRARIEQTADDRGLPGPDEYFGFGRVNAGRAVAP
jgi:subtilisin family serine protease